MNKVEFLKILELGFHELPKEEVLERLTFYGEMIDDIIDEGFSEEEAVSQIGDVRDVISQINICIPHPVSVKVNKKHEKSKKGNLLIAILVSPLWIPLLMAALAVAISIYAAICAIIISLWASELSFVAAFAASVVCGAVNLYIGCPEQGIALIGTGLFFAGFSIFFFFACKWITEKVLYLTKYTLLNLKKLRGGRRI